MRVTFLPAALAVIAFLFTSGSGAAELPNGATLRANAATGPIRIDGVLDDPAWSDAAVIANLVSQVLACAVDQICPPERREQLPLLRLKRRHLGVAVDHVIVLAAPRKREVADSMIPVGQLKVENVGKIPIFEAQIPRREVAMDRAPTSRKAEHGMWLIRLLQLADLLLGERDRQRGHGIVEMLRLARADDRCGDTRLVCQPGQGNLRAWDAVVSGPTWRIGIEAETRLRDYQALQRRIALKQRDGSMGIVLLLVANTRHNRSAIRLLGQATTSSFPLPGHRALQFLTAGANPEASSLVLL